MKKILIIALICIMGGTLYAQDSLHKALTISGYAELYYQYDINNPVSNTKPGFVYSHNRNNELALNLAFIKAAYNTNTVRGNFSIGAGSYMNANYAAENGVMKNVFEANIGVKLSRKNNLWLDAGIFPSHIGFESAVGKDCWTLTRSILADNSPYFETGAKISYTSKNEKWFLSALLLNGWQRIERPAGNTTPAFGTQVTYKPNAFITLNSSSFVGNDKPDSVKQMRYFHNFYGIFQLDKQWSATLGFDIGAEQKNTGITATNTWYSPVFILRYAASNKITLAARAEYYRDKNGVIIATGTVNGFQTWGLSTNLDYAISENVLWRIEAKTWSSQDRIFQKRNHSLSDGLTNFSTSLSLAF